MNTSKNTFIIVAFTCYILISNAFCQNIIDLQKYYSDVEEYFRPENLWNVEIQKPNIDNHFYFLTLKLYSENNILLYKSKTQTFQITQNPYILQTHFSNIFPFESEWIDDNYYRQIQSSGGMLLPGNYIIEYILLSTVAGCNWAGEIILKKNFKLSIQYFNQIDLLYPPDGDTILTSFPNFVWLPITPYNKNIQYDIKVVEVNSNPDQDIFLNLPFLEVKKLYTHQITYPASARKLENNKKYVWVVTALNSDNKIMAISRPFVFYVKGNSKNDTIKLNKNFSYIQLTNNIQNQWFEILSDTLFITIDYKGNDEGQNMSIYLKPKKKKKTRNEYIIIKPGSSLRLKNGWNLYEIPISQLEEDEYQVEIKNPYDNTTYLFYMTRKKMNKTKKIVQHK